MTLYKIDVIIYLFVCVLALVALFKIFHKFSEHGLNSWGFWVYDAVKPIKYGNKQYGFTYGLHIPT